MFGMHGDQIWTQSESDWPQMGQIRGYFQIRFSTRHGADLKKSPDLSHLGQYDQFWDQYDQFWGQIRHPLCLDMTMLPGNRGDNSQEKVKRYVA